MNIVSINVLNNISDNSIIVDIRDRGKYLKGHVPNAINIEEKDLYKYIEKFKNSNNVYIYCDYGNRGFKVVEYLKNNYNLDNVYNIIGGYNVYRGKIEKSV